MTTHFAILQSDRSDTMLNTSTYFKSYTSKQDAIIFQKINIFQFEQDLPPTKLPVPINTFLMNMTFKMCRKGGRRKGKSNYLTKIVCLALKSVMKAALYIIMTYNIQKKLAIVLSLGR